MRLHVDDTHQGCPTVISDKQQEKKETFSQSQPPSASLFKTLLRNPHRWMSYFLFLLYEYNGKKIDPRAEILKLGNSAMSNNTIMNWTERPGGMDLPSRGLDLVESLLVRGYFSRLFRLLCMVFCLWLSLVLFILLPAWIPVELYTLLPLLCPCHICLQIPMLSLKSNLNSFFPKKLSSPSPTFTFFSFFLLISLALY